MAALVFAAVLAAFSPALDNGWVGWDDPFFFLDNPHYRGLGLSQLRWMFTSAPIGQYVPLAWLTLGVDHALWGMEPWGYHLTSLLLHAIAAVLFFGLSRTLLAAAGGGAREASCAAALAALLWALHPLRVESVAWISARRDVLSGALFIATLWLYAGAPLSGRARRRRLWLALTVFAAALLSKIMVATLPVTLLLLDVYPLRRLAADPRRWKGRSAREALREKIPFFALAAAAVVATLAAHSRIGVLTSVSDFGLLSRLAHVFYGLAFYARKTLWPSGLMPLHEAQVPFDPWQWRFAASAVAVLVAAYAAWKWRRRWPAFAAAAVFYVLTLAPVNGWLRFGIEQLAMERFSYLPSLGFSLLAAAAGLALFRRPRWSNAALPACLLAIAALGPPTWALTKIWKDSMTLWGHALKLAPDQAVANVNYGVALAQRGDFEGALRHCAAAARTSPGSVEAHDNEGLALLNLGRPAEARAAFERAAALAPRADVYEHLGLAALRVGDADAALRAFDAAAALRPDDRALDCRSGAAHARAGRAARALERYERCLSGGRTDSRLANARVEFGRLLALAGQPRRAIAQYKLAVYGEHDQAAAQANWAEAALALGDFSGARRHASQALRLKPDLSAARLTLGNALARQGLFKQAADEYRLILKRNPSHLPARHNLRSIKRRF